jgi:DNA-binding NtrC family response regulator
MSNDGRVLIVEDDVDVLRAARLALQAHVQCVETATSADGLRDALAATPYDAVLLDMNFTRGARNGAEGLDALAFIRGVDPTLAVVLMTAYGGVALAVDSLKRGAADFVLKPWRNDALVEAVLGAIDLTRSRRGREAQDLETIEREAIEKALARHAGNISLTASALGLSRPALYRRMSKHGL